MELILLLGLGGAIAVGVMALDSDDADDEIGDGFNLTDTGMLVGTAGNDAITLDDVQESDLVVSGGCLETSQGTEITLIDSGAGDDLIDLIDPTTQPGDGSIWSSPMVEVAVEAGDGNYTINAHVAFASISAGAGDDQILVGSSATNGLVVDAGAGNDTIDGRDVEDGRLLGGAGDDTLRFDAISNFTAIGITQQGAVGGSGSDRFEVLVDEGVYDPYFDPDNLVSSDYPHVTRAGPNTLSV